jgi:hypothetical protein
MLGEQLDGQKLFRCNIATFSNGQSESNEKKREQCTVVVNNKTKKQLA